MLETCAFEVLQKQRVFGTDSSIADAISAAASIGSIPPLTRVEIIFRIALIVPLSQKEQLEPIYFERIYRGGIDEGRLSP